MITSLHNQFEGQEIVSCQSPKTKTTMGFYLRVFDAGLVQGDPGGGPANVQIERGIGTL